MSSDIDKINIMSTNDKTYRELLKHFYEGNVQLPGYKIIESVSKEQIEQSKKNLANYCGFCIYLYLLNKSFPHDRIFMCSAYCDNNTEEFAPVPEWNKKFLEARIRPPESVQKAKACCQGEIDKLGLYSGNNEYFLVRRIVFSAIQYYYELMDKKDEAALDSINNHLKDKDSSIGSYVLKNIFENIKRLYPQTLPKSPEEIYKKTLYELTSPFEAKLNFDKHSDLCRELQLASKLLRNWIAHNKFKAPPTQTEFLLLFIACLLAYFGIDDSVADFETEAFQFIKTKFGTIKAERADHLMQILKATNKSFKLSLDYYSYLSGDKGFVKTPICQCRDILDMIWIWKYNLGFQMSSQNPGSSGNITVNITHGLKSEQSAFFKKLDSAIEMIIL